VCVVVYEGLSEDYERRVGDGLAGQDTHVCNTTEGCSTITFSL